ncbi:MAG TPA: hypothetical protein VGO71_18530 [Baekduia sp.]|jgi:hypothetical protein|nr:hypothetical protein [Baekduia sp.]
MTGCGGGNSHPTPPTTTRASAPSPRRPFYPKIDDRERAALADVGLLRATPPRLRAACAKAAAHTEWTVLCPTLTPGGRLAISAVSGVTARSDDFGAGYEISIDSAGLREKGAPDPGHWTIAAGTPGAMRDQLTAFGHSKPVTRRRVRIGDVQVTRFREPDYGAFPGVYGGHVVYQWMQGRAVLQVSVHGDAHERLLRGLVRLLSRGPSPNPSG